METAEEEISSFGTVMGDWIENDPDVLAITEFAEKPTIDYARSKLRVENLPEKSYLTIFGQYVIKPEIFLILAEHIRQQHPPEGRNPADHSPG